MKIVLKRMTWEQVMRLELLLAAKVAFRIEAQGILRIVADPDATSNVCFVRRGGRRAKQ